MSYTQFSDIFANALWETYMDAKDRIEIAFPVIAGSYNLLLGFAIDLSLISISLGLVVGILSVIEKGLKIYKDFKTLKKVDKEEKEVSEKGTEEEID